MNTFLPYPSFRQSAACLDRQRLGKQRVEVLQILRTLHYGGGWRNHPAVKMWKGYENSLVIYGLAICDEWTHTRGYKDSCRAQIHAFIDIDKTFDVPPWYNDEAFHASHRSNLLRKFPEHYKQFGWLEPPTLPYIWPKGA